MRLPGGGGKTELPVKRGRLGAATGDFLTCQWPGHRRCFAPFSNSPVPLCLGAEENAQGEQQLQKWQNCLHPPATQKGRAMCLPGGGGELSWPMLNPFPMKREGGASRSPLSFGLFVGTILQTGPSWHSVRQKGRSFPARNRLPPPGVFFCLFFYLAENPEPADNVVDGGREGRGPDFHRVLRQPQT